MKNKIQKKNLKMEKNTNNPNKSNPNIDNNNNEPQAKHKETRRKTRLDTAMEY